MPIETQPWTHPRDSSSLALSGRRAISPFLEMGLRAGVPSGWHDPGRLPLLSYLDWNVSSSPSTPCSRCAPNSPSSHRPLKKHSHASEANLERKEGISHRTTPSLGNMNNSQVCVKAKLLKPLPSLSSQVTACHSVEQSSQRFEGQPDWPNYTLGAPTISPKFHKSSIWGSVFLFQVSLRLQSDLTLYHSWWFKSGSSNIQYFIWSLQQTLGAGTGWTNTVILT